MSLRNKIPVCHLSACEKDRTKTPTRNGKLPGGCLAFGKKRVNNSKWRDENNKNDDDIFFGGNMKFCDTGWNKRLVTALVSPTVIRSRRSP
ncbi:hypothetical protein NPIL_189781 [Nephila pilipes]|uniref:Uncharacterized protein n=1 Tax=Nephila pilipes TaxID=299642 RepID=A0A8X6PSI5_NEPPI|nr:hypothetical protein NPIL_189781 [Nephila pilipes]